MANDGREVGTSEDAGDNEAFAQIGFRHGRVVLRDPLNCVPGVVDGCRDRVLWGKAEIHTDYHGWDPSTQPPTNCIARAEVSKTETSAVEPHDHGKSSLVLR
jgi:hypothetical protein